MLKLTLYPKKEEYAELLKRPHKDAADLGATVASVLKDVREGGDGAVLPGGLQRHVVLSFVRLLAEFAHAGQQLVQ